MAVVKDKENEAAGNAGQSWQKKRVEQRTLHFALAGNPNCGKTTLFNQLTGSSQYVGNWPGVTVEKKEGRVKNSTRPVSVLDSTGYLFPFALFSRRNCYPQLLD